MGQQILNNEELKKMFIEMSTNKDLRQIIKYYEDTNMDKENIKTDFLELMEKISTEEIADRISIDLFINFDGITISNKELDESLCFNENSKDVQLEYISKRSDLSYISITGMVDLKNASPQTIDIAIKNSTDTNIHKLDFDEMCYVSKENLFKLLNLAKEFGGDKISNEVEYYLYFLSLKENLTEEEISEILSEMKKYNIEIDNLFGESLLSQKQLTKAQAKEIAIFNDIPAPITFESCLMRELYTEDEIIDIYKKVKDDEEYINILLNSGRIPKEVLSMIYVDGNENIKHRIEKDAENDLMLSIHKDKLLSGNTDKRDTIKLINEIKTDIRLLSTAMQSSDPNILDATYEAINKFYIKTYLPSIYETRVKLLTELAYNENMSAITLHHLLNENRDAFDIDDSLEISSMISLRATDFERELIHQEELKERESLDDYLLDMKLEAHKTYNDQMYEDDEYEH